MNRELPDVPAVFRKGRGTRDQIANIHWIIEKPKFTSKSYKENIYFCFTGYAKAFNMCESQLTVENSLRNGNTRPPYLSPEKPICKSRNNS